MATTKSALTEAKIREMSKSMLQAWNDHDVPGILTLLSDDIIWREPGLPEPARGKEAVDSHLRSLFKAYPDFHLPVEDFHTFPSVEQQANVATWTLTATMTGSFEGLPSAGKSVRTSGTTVTRFADGKVVEYTSYFDSLDFLQQLGLLPKMDSLGFKALVMTDVLAGKAVELADRAVKAMRR